MDKLIIEGYKVMEVPKKEFTSKNVVEIITRAETNPLYKDWSKIRRAWEYIQTLSRRSQKRLKMKINKVVNAYHTEDETGNSPYDYDQMFL